MCGSKKCKNCNKFLYILLKPNKFKWVNQIDHKYSLNRKQDQIEQEIAKPVSFLI